ncbi:MAG TPA: isocitrate dehydrogenase (NAD(+)) [Pyrinomonadaceae bacterium]|nr:isocitrate dehydrogenase (NAD(+)) [Pyrinomonadaceae bacterium]
MGHRVTLIPGDGIGPEVSAAVLRIIEAVRVDIEWERFTVGGHAQDLSGSSLPDSVIESVRRNAVALKGPVATPIGSGFESVNVRLRKVLDLYANLRPVRNLPGVQSRFGNVDLIIVRENTEGLYSGLEHEVVPGVVESLKIITEKASSRIAVFAFEYAKTFGRKKVTCVHKANIMKKSDGLFLQCFRKVALNYPTIEHDEKIVDNLCMQLVMNPYQFDMLLMENLYGDIVSDLAAGLVGGLGVVPSGNLGEKAALFEAVHGTAPDIAGKNLANPTALLMSAIMMLRHIKERAAAGRIEAALNKVLEKREKVTRDLGGTASTTEFTDAIIAAL